MSSSLPKPPPALVRHIREGRCVLFAGAGLSMQAGLPSWTRLLRALVAAVEEQSPGAGGAEIERLFEQQKLLAIADFCKQELGERAYSQALAAQTRGADEELSEAHRLVAKIPFSAVVTTNYDHLLRRAFSGNGGVPRTPTHLDADLLAPLLFEGGFFILKAHGDIDHPDSIVLTRKDFQEIIHANPAFQAIFSALLLTKAVVFVGYSFNDPDFQLLLERSLTLFRGYGPDRYALMNDVDEIEAGVLRRTAGIRVISYTPSEPHHPEVVEFLRELEQQCRPEPRVRLLVDDVHLEARAMPRSLSKEALKLEDLLAEDEQLRTDSSKLRELLSRSFGAPAGSRSGGRPSPAGFEILGVPREGATPDYPPPFEEPEPLSVPGLGGVRGVRGVRSGPKETKEPPSVVKPEPAATVARWRLSAEATGGQLAWELVGEGAGPTGRATLVTAAPDWPAVQGLLKNRHFEQAAGALADQGLTSLLEAVAPGDALELRLAPSIEPYPWEWIEAAGEPICLRYRLHRSPIGVSDAARGIPGLSQQVSMLVIGDPTEYLPGARREAEAVARLWTERGTSYVTALHGKDASVDQVAAELLSGAYDLVHFAGHAWADFEGAYLRLANNEPLRADTLRSLFSPHPPAVVMLNSHFTAFVPAGVDLVTDVEQGKAGLQARASGRGGFTEAASVSGVAAFLGCLGSPTDEGAANLAVAFHQGLAAGLPVNEALRRARRAARDGDPASDDWRYFVLSGRGDVAIPPAG